MSGGSAGTGAWRIQAGDPYLPGERDRAILVGMMPRTLGWSIRAFGFALVGVLTFLVQPPGATAVKAQFVGWVVAGLGLLAWALVDAYPPAARYRARAPHTGDTRKIPATHAKSTPRAMLAPRIRAMLLRSGKGFGDPVRMARKE